MTNQNMYGKIKEWRKAYLHIMPLIIRNLVGNVVFRFGLLLQEMYIVAVVGKVVKPARNVANGKKEQRRNCVVSVFFNRRHVNSSNKDIFLCGLGKNMKGNIALFGRKRMGNNFLKDGLSIISMAKGMITALRIFCYAY